MTFKIFYFKVLKNINKYIERKIYFEIFEY